MHRPAAVSMFAAGFALICEKVQAFRVNEYTLDESLKDKQAGLKLLSNFGDWIWSVSSIN